MSNIQEEFYTRMYKTQHEYAFLIALRIVDNEELAHDVVQQTFSFAWVNIEDFMKSKSPIGWLVNVTKNFSKDALRKRKRQSETFISLSDIPDNLHPHQVDEIDPQILFGDILSEDDFYLLKRRVLEKASFAELAEEFHITIWACEKRMKRLLKKIKQKFDG
jgi:RNA polymerase sigma factor, sigma-70 family